MGIAFRKQRMAGKNGRGLIIFAGKPVGQELLDFAYGAVRSGLGDQKLFIISLSVGKPGQTAGQDGLVLQQQKAVPQSCVGGQQHGLQKPMVLSYVVLCLSNGDFPFFDQWLQPLLKGGLEEMGLCLQSLFCEDGVALLPDLLQKGRGLLLLIGQQRGKVLVGLAQQRQIVFHVPLAAEAVFRQQYGQLRLGS